MASNAEISKAGRGVPVEPRLTGDGGKCGSLAGSPNHVAKSSGRSLWLWVGGAFFFLFCLWAALFFAARNAHIESVPLQSEGVRK